MVLFVTRDRDRPMPIKLGMPVCLNYVGTIVIFEPTLRTELYVLQLFFENYFSEVLKIRWISN